MEKRYRRIFLNHRLLKQQDEAERERQQHSSESEDTRNWSGQTQGEEMNRVRTWRRIKPSFQNPDAHYTEIHITLWDEIDDHYNQKI